MSVSKIVAAAASGVGGAGLDVDEVFSCHLYDGNNQDNRDIVNGIDLANEGGMVWTKSRSNSGTNADHSIADTARGVQKILRSSSSAAQVTEYMEMVQFNSNGYRISYDYNVNIPSQTFVSWTFRKAPKFFDVVTYTGNGSSGKTVSHNLGSEVGMLIVKRTDSSGDWRVFHRAMHSNPEQKYMDLNSTNEVFDNASFWNDTDPTSTQFTVGNDFSVNQWGGTYVAYLFAHNDGDGEFGPDGSDIIKCGSYGGATQPNAINLGFEPQWLLIKNATTSVGDWYIYDSMRGVPTGSGDREIEANDSAAEAASSGGGQDWVDFNATGFTLKDNYEGVNQVGKTYIYMAIRRGPLAAPEDATKVFAIDEGDSSGAPEYTSGFPVDMAIKRYSADTDNWRISARLIQGINHFTNTTAADDADAKFKFDYQNGYYNDSQGANNFAWMWKRAPSYFDVVAYTGTGSARTVSHNLGAVPEMMWVKRRDGTSDWAVYHKGLNGGTDPEDYFLKLNGTNAASNSSTRWNDTAPTSSVFTVGTSGSTNDTNFTYIAYLFASLDGVSKVGSYTGDGTTDGSKVIDCGFSSGARFVFTKRTDATGSWYVHDTVRGIVASGNDPVLQLNNTAAENTFDDYIDPHSSGFSVKSSSLTNASGGSYIFYAIA